MEAQKADPSRYLWGLAVLVLTALVAWLGWSQAHKFARQEPSSRSSAPGSFRVAGSSMVPTLYGPSLKTRCPRCEYEFLIDLQILTRTGESIICSLCGERQSIGEFHGLEQSAAYPGDVVQVTKLNNPDEVMGDLAAVRWDGAIRVKRIIAGFGDEVDVVSEHLIVNGQRVEDRLARGAARQPPRDLLVDDDRLREESRWAALADAQQWQRDRERRWKWYAGNSTWLVYHHRNVHDHHQPSGVLDDYQYNAGVARQLAEVDRLSLAGTADFDKPVTLVAAFWSREGIVVARKKLEQAGRFRIAYHDSVRGSDLPVTKMTPLAIRVEGGPLILDRLRISRGIEYRLRSGDDRKQYPLRIPEDHYYVVGDNVPFSIDSRTVGPIAAERILGGVQMLESHR